MGNLYEFQELTILDESPFVESFDKTAMLSIADMCPTLEINDLPSY